MKPQRQKPYDEIFEEKEVKRTLREKAASENRKPEPDCLHSKRKHDSQRGEIVCVDCGQVIRQNTIGQIGGGSGRADTPKSGWRRDKE